MSSISPMTVPVMDCSRTMVSSSKNRWSGSSVSVRKLAVELARPVLARSGRAREARGVVDDVVGVDGHCGLDVTRALGLEVLLHDGNHLVLLH
jgi:hypothetical protein